MQSLHDTYSTYLAMYAPMRPGSYLRPLADFADFLREQQIDTEFSDETWIEFLLPVVDGDEDRARDLWDALLCQPSYGDNYVF